MNNEPQVDQKRFVLAMVISGIVIVIWQMFFAPELPPPVDTEAAATQTNGQTATQDGEKTKEPVVKLKEEKKAAPAPTKTVKIRQDTIESGEIKVTLSNKGGRVIAFETLKPEQYQAAGNILSDFPEDSAHFLFELSFAKDNITLPKDLVYEVVEAESAKAEGGYKTLVYRYVDPQGRYQLDKKYKLDTERPYHIGLEISLTNHLTEGRLSDHMVLNIFGYKDPNKETSMLDMRPDQFEAICRTVDDTERELIANLENPVSFQGEPIIWGGINTRYFVFASVPTQAAEKCTFDIIDNDYLRTQLTQAEFSIGPGETVKSNYDLYLAPKDLDILDAAGHELGEAVDYGFFTFLARPMRWFLVFIFGFIGNWGFAILLLTIIIRLAMWPINKKVYVNSERMRDVQPKLNAIKEKYEDDQQRMTEETMKIFKEEGVSPLGCAPMFLQFPIFLALYYMILNSTELYQADFMLWYTDLSAPDPYFVLPILMGVVMLAQQQMMMPTEAANPQAEQMQKMMKFMPIMFTAFMLFLPSGVVLYYSASMLIGIIQQVWIKKSFAKQREAAAAS